MKSEATESEASSEAARRPTGDRGGILLRRTLRFVIVERLR